MSYIRHFASLVKISHTVFALPFALVGFFMAMRDTSVGFDAWLLLEVVLCMFFARNAAMSFNRYADRHFDAHNPRTAQREIPRGIIQPRYALAFCVANAALFVLTTIFINPLCLALSPVALAVVLGYSYTKRFTAWCHFVLGLGLGIAPTAAYMAVSGTLATAPILLSAVVLLWCGGFDVLYALPDENFDRSEHLHSAPAALGRRSALWLSAVVHVVCVVVAVVICVSAMDNILCKIGTAIFTLCIAYQHAILSVRDISRVNIAFATTNGFASILYATFCIAGLLWP
jgi:4-hydroxybenzoate polyprenyltransferase